MLIRLYKSNYSLQIIILFVVAIVLWVQSFFHPTSSTHEITPAPFYNYLHYFLHRLPLLEVVLAFVLIIAQGFIINRILIINSIVRKNTLLPAFIYVVVMSQSTDLQTLYPALLSNLFLILLLHYMLKIFNETEAYVEILNAGFLVGIATLFYLPSVFFLAAIWLCFIIYTIFYWREWVISFLGVVIPYIFLFTFYFWFDKMEFMFMKYYDFYTSFRELCFELNVYQFIILTLLMLFVLLGINRIILSLNSKTISIRKKSIIIIWFFIISLVPLIYSSEPNIQNMALSFVPASCIIANYFDEIKKKPLIEILFLLTVLFAVTITFIDHA